jgi:hypothetical protein
MKRGALPWLAFDFDIAPETSGQNESSCQTEAVALAGDDGTFLDLGVTLEYQFLMLRFDPGSVIGNLQQKILVFNRHFDIDPVASMMKGIFQEIPHDLVKFDLILKHFDVSRL